MKRGILIFVLVISVIFLLQTIFVNGQYISCTSNSDCTLPKTCQCCTYVSGQPCGKCCKCTPVCTCASATCYTSTCSNGCGGTCSGTMQPTCVNPSTIQCGQTITPTNNCGTCPSGTMCSSGYMCVSGTCQSTTPVCSDYSDWYSITRPRAQCLTAPFTYGGLPCVRDSNNPKNGFYDQYCLSNTIYNITIN